MASAVDSSGSMAASWERGTAILRPCQRISTSMSAGQTSSGAIPRYFDSVSFAERRDDFGSDALGLEGESDFVIEIVIPAHRLLFRPVGVHDGLVVDAVFPDRVLLRFLHGLASRIRRTEVRPICNRRAISALLTPARYSFRTWLVWSAAVCGRPNRWPFWRACARPARTRSRRISLSNSAKTASNAAMARPAGVVRSSASVSDTNPTPRWFSS